MRIIYILCAYMLNLNKKTNSNNYYNIQTKYTSQHGKSASNFLKV